MLHCLHTGKDHSHLCLKKREETDKRDKKNFYCKPKELENILLMTKDFQICLLKLLKSLLMVQFFPSNPGTQVQV